jgi:gamma-glutamylcyclotransferase (GGCT)/AIG2-like uncharacterized protein YtfP
MPLLFSYGSLMSEAAQLATFGRSLLTTTDSLNGYTQTRVPIRDPARASFHGTFHYANIVPSDVFQSEVTGVILEITEEELIRADQYESQDGYCRVPVFTRSGRRAWAYVYGPPSTPRV